MNASTHAEYAVVLYWREWELVKRLIHENKSNPLVSSILTESLDEISIAIQEQLEGN